MATRITRPLAIAIALLIASAAHAAGVRVLASDDRGVSLEVTVGEWKLGAAAPDGRMPIDATGFHVLAEPGRPMLPAIGAMLALPPGATATARVVSQDGAEGREDVRIAIAGRPAFRRDEGSIEWVPSVDDVRPIADGAWPPSPVVLGRAFPMRGRQLMSVEIRPFRYDETSRRLDVVRRLVVRVDFSRTASSALRSGVPGAPDPQFDPVLESSVLNFEQARAWRVGPGGPSSFRRWNPGTESPLAGTGLPGAFDEDFPEVRVQIDSTGVHTLPFSDLAAKGYPAGVPVAQVSVHRHEYLDGAVPPYTTIELPIEVDDFNANGTFDAGDAIWLHARTWAERSGVGVGQRRWGDADMVFATRKATDGLRMSVRSGWRNAATPTLLTSYPWSQHFEKNYDYTAFPKDSGSDVFSWTPSPTFYYLRDDTITFETNHLDTTRFARVRVNLDGRDAFDHMLWLQVKNGAGQFTSLGDSLVFSGKGAFTPPVLDLRGSALGEGLTNTLRQWGRNPNFPPNPVTNLQTNVVLNSFDLTYWRRFRALRNTLAFNSADANGEFQLRGQGFATNAIRLYDVTDPEVPVRVSIAPAQIVNEAGIGWAFDLQDSTDSAAPRRYVAATVGRRPAASRYTVVTRRNLWQAFAGDYLLVVPEAFLPAMQPLVDLRQSQGLNVLVAPLEAVNDELNGGRHSAYSIQRLTKFAYQNWDSRFMLLVGDGTQNPQKFGTDTDEDWVPVRFIPAPVTTADGPEMITSDPAYGCVTGNCDPVGGLSGPVIPELFVGRIPVHSLQQAQDVVAKLVNYEILAGDQSWRRKVMLQSDDAYSTSSFFGNGSSTPANCYQSYEELFRTINEACSTVVRRDAGLSDMQVEVFNNRYYLASIPLTNTPCDSTRPDLDNVVVPVARATIQPPLFSRLKDGRLWWNYQGHANQTLLAHEKFYVNPGFGESDANLLENFGKPFFFSAFSCHANAHTWMLRIDNPKPDALGEEMVNLPNRGAIASYASTGYEVIPRSPQTHINTYLTRFMFQNPPRDPVLSERGARVVLGEAIGAMLVSYLPTVLSFQQERGVGLTYNLLGDPATRLSIGAPQSIVTANAVPVTSGQPVRLHTAGDSLIVEADLVSTVRLDSLGLFEQGPAGQVEIPASAFTLSPAFPDTAPGNVNGGRRFHLTYRTTLRAETYRYVLRSRDRDGLVTDFVVPFELRSILRVGGTPISDNDEVAPAAQLSLLVLSPKPVADPQAEFQLTIDGAAQAFAAVAAPGDGSNREWILSWDHADYPIDAYAVRLQVVGGGEVTRTFRVNTASGELGLRNAYVFPNPFEDDLGAYFSFSLAGSEAADVKVRVFTVSGRSIYERIERGLQPGYHQLAWDGRDAEGDKLANGVYFYRLSAVTPSGSKQEQLGRIVKLRKPRRVAEPTVP